ncbi:uncharacterized protein LOC132278114 [Cornus florida]|uniref:uncharacterized protein LOC132278114 n=1 Tax=Cornus florida TaxID=4283 RepID=UPI0028A08E51|nr:uncharacterized protein LOC132278114 [Cornus florida]
MNDVKAYDNSFIQKRDATGRLGLSSIQKMTIAICKLVYGCAVDHCDKYIKIGESTTIKALMTFCKAVIGVYGEEYMRPPNEANIARLLHEGEERGFPGMLGSIDFTSKDLWIWHAFFGMPGSNNDINVPDYSPVFYSIVTGQILPVNFIVNGHYHTMGYYLSNGIYPKWANFFAQRQEPVGMMWNELLGSCRTSGQ